MTDLKSHFYLYRRFMVCSSFYVFLHFNVIAALFAILFIYCFLSHLEEL